MLTPSLNGDSDLLPIAFDQSVIKISQESDLRHWCNKALSWTLVIGELWSVVDDSSTDSTCSTRKDKHALGSPADDGVSIGLVGRILRSSP